MRLKICLASAALAVWIPSTCFGDLCPPGYYSTNGMLPGVPAPPGYHVSTSGATNPTQASPGSFVDTSGATSASPAPLGYYCPV